MSDFWLENLTLDVLDAGKRRRILSGATLSIPRAPLVVVGDSRVSVVAFLDLLCRRLIPQSGQLHFSSLVSWPIGHSAPFAVAVTGTQAVSHLATLYGFDRETALAFLHEEFDGADRLTRPILTWPRAMQQKFMLLMALVAKFEAYLVDGNLILPEDPAFSRRFMQMFLHRIEGRTLLMTARNARLVHAMCRQAIILYDGGIMISDDVTTALTFGLGQGGPDPAERGAPVEQDDDNGLF